MTNFEEVSASSGFEYETPLGDFLSVPLKHPFSPSLTANSPLHGQPRVYHPADYVIPPPRNFEAPYTASKTSSSSFVKGTDVLPSIPLLSSTASSPLKPRSPVVSHHSYSPSSQLSSSVSTMSFSKVKLASLHPSYFHLVSSEILSKVPDLEHKRIYYGPNASLIFSCGSNDFLTDEGFPLPEIDVEIGGGADISQLGGLLSWDNGNVDSSLMTVSGPVTRSRVISSSNAVSVVANFAPVAEGQRHMISLLFIFFFSSK